MPVSYDSKRIIPAPFIAIRQDKQTTDDGTPLSSTFTIVIKGTLVSYKGSPNSSGTFWDQSGYPPDEVLTADQFLTSIMTKQQALRSLFSNDGRVFEIDGWDGQTPLKCNPRIKEIDVPDGKWFEVCPYSITMEADCIHGLPVDICNTDLVTKASEEWNIEIADEKTKTYRLTHSVSATGKRYFDDAGSLPKQAWENAKDYVLNKIGLGLNSARMAATGVLNADSLQAFNYLRTQHVNELGGVFAVTETWLCFDPEGGAPAVEEFIVNTRTGTEDGKTRVTVEGTITGLEQKDNTAYTLQTTKWTNAQSKWTSVQSSLLSRAQTISGLTMNTTPLGKVVGYNQLAGVITYNYEYDDRASNEVPGSLGDVVTVIDHHQADVFASIPVLGRALGPVLQDISTKTARKRDITIEATMPASTQAGVSSRPNTTAIILTHRPTGFQVFLENDVESWTEKTGRYSRNTSFTYEL